MGSFLEKNINWEKESNRLLKFLASINNLLDNTPVSFSDNYLKKMKGEIKHFKKLFEE